MNGRGRKDGPGDSDLGTPTRLGDARYPVMVVSDTPPSGGREGLPGLYGVGQGVGTCGRSPDLHVQSSVSMSLCFTPY